MFDDDEFPRLQGITRDENLKNYVVVPPMPHNKLNKLSFASASLKSEEALFPQIPMANRTYSIKNGIPAILFTQTELAAADQQLSNALIAKFTAGRPPLQQIRDHIHQNWNLGEVPTVGLLDHRHVLIILRNEADVIRALSCESHRIGTSLFRLFHWTPDFDPKKESTLATIWIKLPQLPMRYYNISMLKQIVSSFGTFL